jgi:hypothetical protein
MSRRSRWWLGALVFGLLVAGWGAVFFVTPRTAAPRQQREAAAAAPAPASASPPAAAPLAPAEATPRQLIDPELDAARAEVRATIASVADLARAHIAEPKRFASLRGCAPAAGPACVAMLSDALYEVLTQHVEPALLSGALGTGKLAQLDPDAVHGAANELLESSDDPIERVSALAVLERAPRLKAARLAKGAFRELGSKPVVETQMLLIHSVHHGLPDAEVAREVMLLGGGAETDPRARVAALEALADPAGAAQLNEAVRSLSASKPHDWDGWRDSVAPALGRCGLPCTDEAVRLLTAVPNAAELAESIVRLSGPSDRADVLDRLEPALPEAAARQIRLNVDL